MKAENAELKAILANFTQNYNKFEDLTKNTIQRNGDALMRLINELNSQQKQRLTALNTSNEIVNMSISNTITTMKDEIRDETTSICQNTERHSRKPKKIQREHKHA